MMVVVSVRACVHGVGDGSDGGASLLVVLPHRPRCLVVDEGCVAALAVARMASLTLSPCRPLALAIVRTRMRVSGGDGVDMQMNL